MTSPMRLIRSDLWLNPVFDEVIGQCSEIHQTIFATNSTPESNRAAFADAHVYHVGATKDELPKPYWVSRELIEVSPNLVCVSSRGAGFDTVDAAACTAAGIAVVNQSGGNAVSVAEHTLGLILGISRRMIECDRLMRREKGFPRERVMGREIQGKVLGLVGIGAVGTKVALLAKAFGMPVIAYDPYKSDDDVRSRGASPVSFDALLATADIVSLHCPRDPSTLNLITASTYAKMKKGAIFITTARGGIHDEVALAEALKSEHLSGAGLDVWHPEPPELDNPLLAMDNVYATYHTAGVTHEARYNMAKVSAEQLVGLAQGIKPPRIVNPEVWPAFQARYQRIMGKAIA